MTRKVHSVGIYYIKNLLKIKKGYNIVELFFKRTNYIIQSEKPIIDLKYDILKHPNIKYTADGNSSVYKHGSDNRSISIISLDSTINHKDIKEIDINIDDYIFLSSEEIEEKLEKRGK